MRRQVASVDRPLKVASPEPSRVPPPPIDWFAPSSPAVRFESHGVAGVALDIVAAPDKFIPEGNHSGPPGADPAGETMTHGRWSP